MRDDQIDALRAAAYKAAINETDVVIKYGLARSIITYIATSERLIYDLKREVEELNDERNQRA